MTRREKWSFTIAFSLIGIVGSFAILRGEFAQDLLGLRSYEIKDPVASQGAAEKIIFLLESYKAATGDFPRTLDELEDYFRITIDDVPSGYRKWRYNYVERNNYILMFGANDNYYPCYYYKSSTGQWSVDQ